MPSKWLWARPSRPFSLSKVISAKMLTVMCVQLPSAVLRSVFSAATARFLPKVDARIVVPLAPSTTMESARSVRLCAATVSDLPPPTASLAILHSSIIRECAQTLATAREPFKMVIALVRTHAKRVAVFAHLANSVTSVYRTTRELAIVPESRVFPTHSIHTL